MWPRPLSRPFSVAVAKEHELTEICPHLSTHLNINPNVLQNCAASFQLNIQAFSCLQVNPPLFSAPLDPQLPQIPLLFDFNQPFCSFWLKMQAIIVSTLSPSACHVTLASLLLGAGGTGVTDRYLPFGWNGNQKSSEGCWSGVPGFFWSMVSVCVQHN